MTKVVRAFSLDEGVSEELDRQTSVPGKLKPMNKSKFVNDALRFFLEKNINTFVKETRLMKDNLTAGLRAKDATIQGLEQQLAEKEAEIFDLIQHIRGRLVCRCLWCRLKKRLQKSQAEQ